MPTENRQLKTGLFFGSFNPIHIGHLIIANYMAMFSGLKEVWLVVSPHNPLKLKSGLANMYDRLEMAKLATENAPQIKVSDIEFKLPQPSYTIDTLTHLRERYPAREFVLIMGADNLVSFKKWKNYEVLLKDYHIFVYPRPGADVSEWENHPSITFTDTPEMEISSTFIRKAIKDGKNVQFFVPDNVLEFIEKKNMYR
ncbi:nicotinate (nicotinamide) nucleotide adenylyltransferase [Pedobacter sp. ASV12]|uniref:nicotinate (nicotinamide) nucleotide adenylyltransferase n=1 Tax=Pedobacter sp. ASV12 TaxID=2795120 RepID=UPI001E64F71C|nr:nicotinate (nicotinamide) nucleotide adenylyltransferase [Pedobacter sp. ASV12]